MGSVRDLIGGSLRLLGVLASGEQPTANEAADALASLNSLIDTWRLERLMVYAVLPTVFPFVANKLSYTLGPNGDWAMARPVKIEKVQMSYTLDGGPLPLNLPVEILDLDTYQRFVVPQTASTIPRWVYIDDGFPLRTLYFFTVPTIVNQVSLFTWQQLTSFATINDMVSLPPGYERALRYGLATELADEYGKELSPQTISKAQMAKAVVKANNAPMPLMTVDDALIARRGGFNYLTGE